MITEKEQERRKAISAAKRLYYSDPANREKARERAKGRKKPDKKPFFDRFYEKIDKRGPDECWPWIGARSGAQGHGYFRLESHRSIGAHRIAFALANGFDLEQFLTIEKETCHTCDNPPCCNPAHLFLGTHKDNMDDARMKGKFDGLNQGEKSPSAKLTNAQVVAMRDEYRNRWGEFARLGRKYGISRTNAQSIILRRTWVHV